MQRKRRNRGFTMAEMLIVVAVILVLAAVGMIAVQNYRRSLVHLERDAAAKELYVAAQNHLTMAKSQGYLGITNFGEPDGSEDGVYYFVVNGKGAFASESASRTMLDLMLPFGSIDETVRTGGSYVIRYRPDAAAVLDVFYCSDRDTHYKHALSADEYSHLKDVRGADQRNNRRIYGRDKSVLGWYGGNVELDSGAIYEAPIIEVVNAERLVVRMTPPESFDEYAKLALIITGETSGAQAAIPVLNGNTIENDRVIKKALDDFYIVVLDDVTQQGMHFADLNLDTSIDRSDVFLPGENITVQAVVYNNEKLTNIAYSGGITTNSLFADIEPQLDESDEETGVTTALVGNFRHLINLDDNISSLTTDYTDTSVDPAVTLKITDARQINDLTAPATTGDLGTTPTLDLTVKDGGNTDLSWPGFVDWMKKLNDTTQAQVFGADGDVMTENGLFPPLCPTYALTYEGGYVDTPEGSTETTAVCHGISGVKVDGDGAAGLFGEVKKGETGLPLTVQNLKLIDFSIKGTGHAGALAGALANGSSVKNVVAYNTPEYETELAGQAATKDKVTVCSTGANAGGLVGYMVGTDLERCAAALVVVSEGDDACAGGLVGRAGGGSVTSCYAGGHTDMGEYYSHNTAGKRTDAMYNVTANGSAGGLIGDAGAATIRYSYSTCSAKGATVGGFVGNASGKIEKCYATGLVCGTNDDETGEGAFAGSYTGSDIDGQYFEIINERPIQEDIPGSTEKKTVGFDYLKPVGNSTTIVTVTPFDVAPTTENTYGQFVGEPKDWRVAKAYDDALKQWYLRTKNGEAVKDDEGNAIVDYVLGTIAQLTPETSGTSDEADDLPNLVAVHYGDWPAPEWFVINVEG